VLSQTITDLELFIVGGGVTPAAREIIRQICGRDRGVPAKAAATKR